MANRYGDIFDRFRGELRESEPLSRHTSLKVGGPADLYALPEDSDDLALFMGMCRDYSIPWLIIGGGYNTLVRDGGFRGAVVSLKKLKAVNCLPENRVRVQTGISNQRLVGFLEKEGLSGLEFLCGIPGSVGGALAMNAGCHGYEIMDCLESLTILNENGVNQAPVSDLEYGYRFLRITQGSLIIEACFQLAADDPTAIAVRVQDFLEKRRILQKVEYPNAGSFFKNPPHGQAWRLIDAASLRGVTVGGAQVSEQHTNYLVNRGGATANDFIALAKLVKERVRATSGIELEEEVRIVGEEY